MKLKKLHILVFIYLFFLNFSNIHAKDTKDTKDDFYPWSVSDENPSIYGEEKTPEELWDISTNPAVSFVWLLKFYNLTSSSEHACTFMPTCSEYTKQAIVKHGFLMGILMGAERVLRYHEDFRGYELYPTKLGYKLYDPLIYNDFWFFDREKPKFGDK